MNKEIIDSIVRNHFIPVDDPENCIEAQMWNKQWWRPIAGCDTLQNLIEDLYKAAEKSHVKSFGFAESLFLSRNVEPNPNCACRACNPQAWWMVVCSICGNKRCPHATHHDHACTNSNATGQPGSGF
jgi:hypothetical protein